MSAYYITTIISTQELTMSHISSTSGSAAQAPEPSVTIVRYRNPYHPRWAVSKKTQQKPAHQFKSHSHHITLYT